MVEEVVLGNILRIYGTLHDHLPSHGSSVYYLDQIHEILLRLETAHKFGVIRGATRENSKTISNQIRLNRLLQHIYICGNL